VSVNMKTGSDRCLLVCQCEKLVSLSVNGKS